MNCKYCQAELEDGKTLCPACGKDNAEKTEDVSLLKKIACVLAVLVLVAALVAVVIGSMDANKVPDPSQSDSASTPGGTSTPATTPDPTVPANGDPNNATCKGSYTVSDEEAWDHRNDVVATFGDYQLTNGQLQVFYCMQVLNFLDENASYLYYYGLDYTQPLDTQLLYEDLTWQQYFLQCAIDDWKFMVGLKTMALEAGYQLEQSRVDALSTLSQQMEELAVANGYENADALMKKEMGPGSSLADYLAYMELTYWGYDYYDHMVENMEITPEELDAYFTENQALLEENGVTKESGMMADVRHILVLITGGTKDESGNTVYSDEDWANCEAAAQAILDEWKAGEATEESFAALATAKTEDGGSKQTGGLYTNIYSGTNFVPTFKNWCLDETRKPGDTDLVKSDYGYHIMYYVSGEPIWQRYCTSGLASDRISQLVVDLEKSKDVKLSYEAILLGDLNLA